MPDVKHQQNLSINSINSLIEPTTPPSYGKSLIWEGMAAATAATTGGGSSGSGGKMGSIGSIGSMSSFGGPQNVVAAAAGNSGAGGRVAGGTGGAGAASVAGGGLVVGNGRDKSSGNGNGNGAPATATAAANLSMAAGTVSVANSVANSSAHSSAHSAHSAHSFAASSANNDHKLDKEYINGLSKMPLEQLAPNILMLSKDQHGCRFLQKKIDENINPNYQTRLENFRIIFAEICPHIYELIIDPFGNYLIQKLIDYCDEANTSLILEILKFNLFQISINQHGTRALQKIINSLSNDYQLSLLISGLKPFIIELIKDLNGNHVIQKILNKYSPESCQFIYDSILDDLFIVATHKHGCCVLQKCLNHVNNVQLSQFAQNILSYENFSQLINDQFGNYVLQYLISINSISVNVQMYRCFVKFGIQNLCNLKFSSNVVEKFLKNCYANEPTNTGFLNLKFELCYNMLTIDLNRLINDPFGNYVVQTLIDILINPAVNYTNPPNKYLLMLVPANCNIMNLSPQLIQVAIIKSWFANCKISSSFGKRIQLKINSLLNSSMSSHGGGGGSGGGVHPYATSKLKSQNFNSLNMNANGEFVNSENAPGVPFLSASQKYPPPQRTAMTTPFQQVSLNTLPTPLGTNYVFGNTSQGNVYPPLGGANGQFSNIPAPSPHDFRTMSGVNVPQMNGKYPTNLLSNEIAGGSNIPLNKNRSFKSQFMVPSNINYFQN